MSGSARIGATPPGPRGYPLLGVFPAARRDPLGFFLAAAQTYGDVVALPLGVRRLYLLRHPDHIRYVLQEDDGPFRKAPAAGRIRPLFGTSLTTVDGEAWHRRRRLIRPGFTPERLAAALPIFVEATDVMLRRWREPAEASRPVDVFDEMTELTRTIILRVLFGNVPDEEARAVARAITIVAEHVNRGLWSWLGWLPRLPAPRQRRYENAVELVDGFMSRRIGEGRRRGPARDLLSTLLAALDDERDADFADAELRDELKALFVAGHVTTASGLAWVSYVLSQDTGARRRLQREARAVLGTRRPNAPDLSQLEYTRLVIDETLRLYPPTWITARTTTDAVDIGAYRIPRNATVLLSSYVTQRDPRFWDDAEHFDPERFRRGSPARPRYAYFPFGGGPRTCVGSAFALMEMQVIVAMVAQRYDMALTPGWRVQAEPGTVLVPRGGLPIVLCPGDAA